MVRVPHVGGGDRSFARAPWEADHSTPGMVSRVKYDTAVAVGHASCSPSVWNDSCIIKIIGIRTGLVSRRRGSQASFARSRTNDRGQ